jgi:hypothetical protein
MSTVRNPSPCPNNFGFQNSTNMDVNISWKLILNSNLSPILEFNYYADSFFI